MTKKFNSTYLLFLVVLAGALVIAPMVTGLAQVEDVSVDLDDLTGATHKKDTASVYEVSFTTGEDLNDGDTISIVFPDGFTTSSITEQADVTVEEKNLDDTGEYNLVGQRVDIQVPSGAATISSGNTVNVILDADNDGDGAVTNVDAIGSYTVDVYTSEESTSVESSEFVIGATESSQIALNASTDLDDYTVGVAAEYTVNVNPNAELLTADGDTLSIEFPEGVGVPTSISDPSYVTIGGTALDSTGDYSADGQVVKLTVPEDTGTSAFDVVFSADAEFTNPTTADDADQFDFTAWTNLEPIESGAVNYRSPIVAGDVSQLEFSGIPDTADYDTAETITVTTKDQYGNETAPAENTDVILESSTDTGEFSGGNVNTAPGTVYVTFTGDSDSSKTFDYKDTQDADLTASDENDAWTEATGTFSVNPQVTAELYHNGSLVDSFNSLQSAINAAVAGDKVVAGDGTYMESITVDVKNLTIESENGPSNAIIDASGIDTNVAVTIAAEGVTLGGEGVGFEIVAPDGSSDLTSGPDKNFGVEVLDYDDVTVIGNEIGGDTESPQIGIRVENSSAMVDLQILDNTISTTYTPEQEDHVTSAGIRIHAANKVGEDDGDTLIEGNDISGFSIGAFLQGLGGTSNDPVVVELNDINGNDYNGLAVNLNDSANGKVEVSENDLYENGGNGLAIGGMSETAPTIDVEQNDIWGNGNGIEVYNNVTDVSNLAINNNDIKNNTNTAEGYENLGIYNDSQDGTNNIDAEENYWGADSGPAPIADTSYNTSPAPQGDGDKVDDYVDYEPWLDGEDAKTETVTAEICLDAAGWNMFSVNAMPFENNAEDLFGETNASNMFSWDPVDGYESGSSVEVFAEEGYWYYATSSDTTNGCGNTSLNESSDNAYAQMEKTDYEFDLPSKSSWYMISAPFAVDWGKVKVKGDGDWKLIENAKGPDQPDLISSFLYEWSIEDGEYKFEQAPDGLIKPGKAYWVNTLEDAEGGLDVLLPYEPAAQPDNVSAAAAAVTSNFEPVPAGAPKPPTPPAAQGASGELKADAAVTSEGVTFEVNGADVNAIDVQVFNTNGTEVFAESAEGSSLSWDADVANGVYLYGVTAEVSGDSKPLGIQKLLILS